MNLHRVTSELSVLSKSAVRLVVPLMFGALLAGCGGDEQSDDVMPDGVTQDEIAQDEVAQDDMAPDDAVPDEVTCDAGAWGTHAVGVKLLDLVDASRADRTLPTAVYYPATGTLDGAACDATYQDMDFLERYMALTVCGTKDAALDLSGAPYPVVVFSHGSGSFKEGHKYLYEYLVSHGYVVVAPDHTGNVGLGESEPEDLYMTLTRELDLRFAIDHFTALFAAAEGEFASLGDADRLAVAGHSWGGHAAMALAGLEYNFESVRQKCDQGEGYDKWYCAVTDVQEQIEAVPDSRVKVALTFANDAGHQMAVPDCKGASGITIPYLQMVGDQDPYCDVQLDGWKCYEAEKGPACIVVFTGAGHLGYTDMMDEAGYDLHLLHQAVRAYSTAFLRAHLEGDAACAASLATNDLASSIGGSFTAKCRDAL